MAFDPNKIQRRRNDLPARIVVYGPKGTGKTTFAASFPSPFFIQTEDGGGDIEITSAGLASGYGDVMEQIEWLSKGDHEFKTFVLDSLDWFEPMVWAEACRREGWPDIEKPGYGKGYVAAAQIWREYLDFTARLRSIGMMVVQIGHAEIKQFDDPETDSYSQYRIKLQKRAAEIVGEDADIVGFLNHITTVSKENGKTRAVGGGQTALNLTRRPAFDAKCRYHSAPERIVLPRENGFSAIAGLLPGYREEE